MGNLQLKGHLRLITKNVCTGRTKVIAEGDNVVTNAVPDIMKLNMLGQVDFTKIFDPDGLYKRWFGGVMCYENQHSNTGANNYLMEANPVTAHAGMTPIDPNHDDDLARGQAVGSSIIRSDNSVKLVFEWGPTHGNGIISAVALTHTDTGSYGNGNEGYHFRNTFTPWEQIQASSLTALSQGPRDAANAFCQYDDNHTLVFFLGEDEWYQEGSDGFIPESPDCINDITVYIRRLPYTKSGLFDITPGTTNNLRKFTVTTSLDMWYPPAYYFDYENKYLWLFTNFEEVTRTTRVWSRTTAKYSVIDCENGQEVDYGEIESNDEDLAWMSCSSDGSLGTRMYYGNRVFQQSIIKDGNYVYLPMGDSETWPGNYKPNEGAGRAAKQNFSGFKKINLNDQSDQIAIPFYDNTITMDKYYAAIKSGGLGVGFGWVMNNGLLYPCNTAPMNDTSGYCNEFDNIYVNEADSPVVYATRRSGGEDPSPAVYPRYILANKLVNTTKINLATAVQKSASDALYCEYTLTETTS